MQAAANLDEESSRLAQPGGLRHRVRPPTPPYFRQAADLVLPTSMWVEKEGAYGNADVAPSSGVSSQRAAAEQVRCSQMMEFAKRFTVEESATGTDRRDAGLRWARPYTRCSIPTATVDQFPFDGQITDNRGNATPTRALKIRLLRAKGSVRGIPPLRLGTGHGQKGPRDGQFQAYHESRGLAGRESTARNPWRFREGFDRMSRVPNPQVEPRATVLSTAARRDIVRALRARPGGEPGVEFDSLALHRPRTGHWHLAR